MADGRCTHLPSARWHCAAIQSRSSTSDSTHMASDLDQPTLSRGPGSMRGCASVLTSAELAVTVQAELSQKAVDRPAVRALDHATPDLDYAGT